MGRQEAANSNIIFESLEIISVAVVIIVTRSQRKKLIPQDVNCLFNCCGITRILSASSSRVDKVDYVNPTDLFN
jgi:hypothetical protein